MRLNTLERFQDIATHLRWALSESGWRKRMNLDLAEALAADIVAQARGIQ